MPCKDHGTLLRVKDVKARIKDGCLTTTVRLNNNGTMTPARGLNIQKFKEIVYCKDCSFVVSSRR